MINLAIHSDKKRTGFAKVAVLYSADPDASGWLIIRRGALRTNPPKADIEISHPRQAQNPYWYGLLTILRRIDLTLTSFYAEIILSCGEYQLYLAHIKRILDKNVYI